MGKRILSLLIAATLFLTSVMTDSLTVNAAEQQNPVVKSEIKGTVSNNLNKQSYERWASTVKSYLVENADGTMTRVEYAGTHVAVELYSAGGELLSCRDIEPELPLFGGFYAGENENFLVFGQINPDENDETEVIRVVKYTKDWERAGAAGLYGANTVKPFDAGSLRMAQDGDILYVRTCHEMYKWIDGMNHQANLMFSVKIPTMEIADKCSGISNSNFGYVSHSFNQFIEVNGSELAAVDHGDANPRSVVLTKYNKTEGQEVFTGNSGNCTVVNAFNIKGQLGDNSTGVSVGGFEYSDTSYLIAGNSVLQDESYNPYVNRNIFISSTPIDNFKEPQIHWITNHNKNVSNPQMVKIDGNRLLLLWTEDNVLHYVFLNAEGEPDSEVYSSEVGALSDCKPVLIGQNVVWYCTSKDVPLFYAININSPDTVDILNRSHIVKYELMGGSMAESTEKTVNYGSVYGTLPKPVKEGFLFLGWYTDAENGNIVTEGTAVTAAGNEKLYARWLEKQPCGENLSWNIEDGVLTISGTGEMYDLKYNAQPWYNCKHLFQKIVIEDGVENIGNYAFYNFANITDAVVADSVSAIGIYVFTNCKSLRNLKLPKNAKTIGDYAFYNCTGLESVVIPDGVRNISDQMFSGCSSLTEVIIPESVECILSNAFSGCSSLSFVNIPKGLISIGQRSFYNCSSLKSIELGEKVFTIGSSAFEGCTGLEEVTIPLTVTHIGDKAFSGHSGNLVIYGYKNTIAETYAVKNSITFVSLASGDEDKCGENLKWNLTDGILTISGMGEMTDWISDSTVPWYSCREQIVEAVVENGVTGIGRYAFAGCSSLTYITIPDSVISIDNTSFSNHREDLAVYGYENTTAETYAKNNNITFIKLSVEISGICGENLTWKLDNEEGILTISGTGEMADWKNVFSVPWNSHLSIVKEVVIEDGVTGIGRYAFFASSYLTKVTIPDSMKYIDDYAFNGCKSLTDIKIPFGVRRIGKYAFYGCSSLNSVVLFEGITKIEPYTFSYCSNLSSIKFPESLTTIGEYAFFNCTNLDSIEFPDSMELIGQVAFYGCSSLNKIVIPEGVKSIDAYTFTNCSNLEEITVPKTVTYIEDTFLVGCKRNMVIYGYKGTMAEEYAQKRYINFIDISSGFSGNCSEKLSWNLENGILTVTGTGEMPNWSYDSAPWYRKRDSICEVIIGEGVTSIGKFAFNDCANLEKITLPVTMASIDDTSFSGCSSDMMVLGYENTYTDEYAKEKGLFFIPVSYEFSGIYGEGIEWSLKNGKLTVSGRGKMEDIGVAANIPWNSYKLLINEVEVTEGIERIAFNVFSGCRYLNKVKIADSVTEIGTHVFSGCKSLKNITLPKGIIQISDRLFYGCDSLTGIDIPEGVTKIGIEAFSGCISLTDLKIPESVKSISYEAFSGCSNITFMEIPDSVEYIGKRVFLNCRELREVTLPDNLREISDEMFAGCAGLTNIAIPDSVKIMGKSIFKNCTDLRSIVIPNQVEIIESNTFYGCVSLKSVLVPTSVILIDDAAFSGCSDSVVIHCYKNTAAEEYVTKNDMVSEVYSYEYSGKCTEDIMWHLKDGILTISSTEEVSGQDDWSYEDSWKPYSNGIVQIVIKEGVSRIGNSAFSKCSRLCNVEIPNGITAIGYNAFYGCGSLTAIQIPDGVIEIGSSAFSDCSGLKEVKFLGEKPRFLKREAFGNVTADGYYPANSESWDGITEDLCGGTFKWSTFYLAEGICSEGLSWNLDGAGTLTLNGTGQMESFETAENVPWHSYKDKIKNIVISDGIISIGDYAFYGITGLEKIVIPSAVSSIGAYALGNCTKLTEIIFHGSMPDFKTGVFEGVTAQVYYPADDSSWKNTENNPAGGNLTWNNHVHIEVEDSEKPATCTENGLTAGSHCSVCDKIINAQQEIPALGHIEMESAGKKPTCTEKGITSGVYCLRCNIYLKESESIEALGHNWDEGSVEEHATCMQTGTMLYVCTVCGKHRTQELEISSHALDYCLPIAATCTMPGQIEHWNCRVCGKDFGDAQASAELENLISVALGHKWQEGTVTKEATCTEKGIEVYICSQCGESMEMELEMTPHILDYCPPKAGTCITPGIAEHWNCRICKKDFGDAQAVTEPDSLIVNGTHKWNGWKRTAKATVFSAEKQKRTCSLCNMSEERKFGKALKPYITLTANSLKMQIKQATAKFKVTGMAAGDYVVSVKSGNTKILKVSNVKKNGTFKLTAQKKTGTVKFTITLASGLKKTIKINIGKGKVHTTKITIASKKVSLKKGRKMTLKPIVYPVTSQQKVTYKSTDRKIADVNSKGIITAKKKGTAKITVSSGSKKLTVTVKVTK